MGKVAKESQLDLRAFVRGQVYSSTNDWDENFSSTFKIIGRFKTDQLSNQDELGYIVRLSGNVCQCTRKNIEEISGYNDGYPIFSGKVIPATVEISPFVAFAVRTPHNPHGLISVNIKDIVHYNGNAELRLRARDLYVRSLTTEWNARYFDKTQALLADPEYWKKLKLAKELCV